MKRLPLNMNDYQSFVQEFHAESERAAIVMAGGFLDHYLALLR